jgi:4-amino-4-deoxy-L-arabinose transferase-like glycosyltransferase
LPYYATKLGLALGLVLLLLFLVGVFAKVRQGSGQQGRWVAAGALIFAVLIFQSIAPVGLEARHLIPILPAALMFAAAGFHFLATRLAGWRMVALTGGVLIGIGWALLPFSSKGSAGFLPLAEAMLSQAGASDVALVSSDATGEGVFIADVALHDLRPGRVIQRASKSLASSTWSGSGYTPAFNSDDDVYRFLTDGAIQYLVVDDAVPADKRREHHEQIRRVIEQHPERFTELASADAWRGGAKQSAPVKLYKISPKH